MYDIDFIYRTSLFAAETFLPTYVQLSSVLYLLFRTELDSRLSLNLGRSFVAAWNIYLKKPDWIWSLKYYSSLCPFLL